jgi:glycosyltransferase involved in cell wall biosynthesis
VNGAVRVYARKRLQFYTVAPGLVPWLWRHVREFDVVHIHALFSFTSVCAGLIAGARGVPYVVRPLGVLTAYGVTKRRPWLKRRSIQLIEGPILRRAARVHFTSAVERDEAEALGIAFRSVVIPLAVDGVCRTETASASRGTAGPEILFLSRLDPKKNLEALLRAVAALGPELAGARLSIAGDGAPDYVASLKRLAVSLGVEDRIMWHGQVDAPGKQALLAAADIFVLPSFSENFGLAAAEALAAGLPCILGRGVAIAEPAEAAGAAIVVGPEPEAVLAALTRLLNDPGLRRDMGRRARDHAAANYSTAAMAQALIALYQSVQRTPNGASA